MPDVVLRHLCRYCGQKRGEATETQRVRRRRRLRTDVAFGGIHMSHVYYNTEAAY